MVLTFHSHLFKTNISIHTKPHPNFKYMPFAIDLPPHPPPPLIPTPRPNHYYQNFPNQRISLEIIIPVILPHHRITQSPWNFIMNPPWTHLPRMLRMPHMSQMPQVPHMSHHLFSPTRSWPQCHYSCSSSMSTRSSILTCIHNSPIPTNRYQDCGAFRIGCNLRVQQVLFIGHWDVVSFGHYY